jgi:DNA helicase IV
MRSRARFYGSRAVDLDEKAHWARRVAALDAAGRSLCFGRIDTEEGERWYIGRRHIEDVGGEPAVLEWRVPVAVPFYRASVAEPLGLVRRRQFVADGHTLLSMADDTFGSGAEATQVRGRDALLAELERSRAGEMLDIVATIQTEQDEVIRASQAGVMAVQGGPGSGKTAVGLHRAAFLLYGNDALARAGVLVVGPNRTFLRYIGLVLPSLGEEAVRQVTLPDLVSGVRVRGTDAVEAERVKGDARMAEVLRRALHALSRDLTEPATVEFGLSRFTVDPAAAAEVARDLRQREAPYNARRVAAREQLMRPIFEAYQRRVGLADAADYGTFAAAVRNDKGFKAALDRVWPAVSGPALVRDVLSNRRLLARAAEGVLSAEKQAAIHRRKSPKVADEQWTPADLALIDEVEFLLEGRRRTYGHVVVDEAQDLSPMQLRMLARRNPGGSMTVLGDLAQGSGVWAHDRWEEVIAHLATPDGWRVEELRLGYRAPGKVLDLASRLLAEAAPDIRPTESIRPGRFEPRFISCESTGLVAAVVGEAAALADHFGSVAVIAPSSVYADVARGLAASGVDAVEADRAGLEHRVTLVPALAARGLEFDAVVVVEPADVVADAPRGLRLLYICLTRPTQHLSVVHSAPLPAALRVGASG